jgi:hypothetical protein
VLFLKNCKHNECSGNLKHKAGILHDFLSVVDTELFTAGALTFLLFITVAWIASGGMPQSATRTSMTDLTRPSDSLLSFARSSYVPVYASTETVSAEEFAAISFNPFKVCFI